MPGWAAQVGAILFLGGIQFLILGCLGEYIGRIYNEVKQRPRWIVNASLGLPTAPPEHPRRSNRDYHLVKRPGGRQHAGSHHR